MDPRSTDNLHRSVRYSTDRHDSSGNADRRTDRRVSRTRRALKDALTSLILEKGYESVTVQDIIDRADVGRSTFYAHFVDRDELLMAIFADLETPAPDPTAWRPDDPPFGWTLQLFRHFEGGKRVFKAVSGLESGAIARHETNRWLETLARAELGRLRMPQRHDPATIEMVVRFMVGTFVGFMAWWIRDENEALSALDVDRAFRALVLPGVANVLGLDVGDVAPPVPPVGVTTS
jgi:AcrR family transcriptional regulator